MKALYIDFTDKEITPWGGMALLKQMLDRIDFESVLRNADLPAQGSNRGYSPEQLLTNFLVGVWCGANCFEHLEVTRHDHAIGEIFGWSHMPGHRAFKRYFQKFDQGINQRVFTTLYQ
ncbi:MAG: IS1380 family transposase, partial [Bacteroidales bacterium]